MCLAGEAGLIVGMGIAWGTRLFLFEGIVAIRQPCVLAEGNQLSGIVVPTIPQS